MKTTYTLVRDEISPPVRSSELALFTCALQAKETREGLSLLGREIPDELEIVHNERGDDPPDIEALELGWECTEFPPDQSALKAVYEERGSKSMTIPPLSQTGRKTRDIRARLKQSFKDPPFFSPSEEADYLESIFLYEVIGGPRSKDIPGNDVLLLDGRLNHLREAIAETAIRSALDKITPKHIKLILLVQPPAVGKETPIARAVLLFPRETKPQPDSVANDA